MKDAVIEEATNIVQGAAQRDITVRLLGSLGVRLHCPDLPELHDLLDRRVKDVDLVCRKSDRNQLCEFLEERGYENDRRMLIAMEGSRYLFHSLELDLDVDVFIGDLDFNHVVSVNDRLDQHEVTISLEDLVLHKLQVVEPTAGDLKDIFALLDVHPVQPAANDPEIIDQGHIARVLAADWGFHHTAVANLNKLREALPSFSQLLDIRPVPEAAKERVDQRIRQLLDAIDAEPKTLRWKMRAKVGERMQWWQDVDNPRGAY